MNALLRILKDNDALASSEYEKYKEDTPALRKDDILLHPESLYSAYIKS